MTTPEQKLKLRLVERVWEVKDAKEDIERAQARLRQRQDSLEELLEEMKGEVPEADITRILDMYSGDSELTTAVEGWNRVLIEDRQREAGIEDRQRSQTARSATFGNRFGGGPERQDS